MFLTRASRTQPLLLMAGCLLCGLVACRPRNAPDSRLSYSEARIANARRQPEAPPSSAPTAPEPEAPIEDYKPVALEEPVKRQPTMEPAPSSLVRGARVDWDESLTAYQYCKYENDCSDGKDCMDRGDRVFMCMGDGKVGAPCVYRHHCHPGLLCNNRGDGLNVCIGDGVGKVGDPCNVDSNCESDLVCSRPHRGPGVCASERR